MEFKNTTIKSNTNIQELSPVDIGNPKTLKRGVYKLRFTTEKTPSRLIENIGRAIKSQSEYKRVLFHKISVTETLENQSEVVVILEIFENPISLVLITAGVIGVLGTGSLFFHKAEKLADKSKDIFPYILMGLSLFSIIVYMVKK